MDNSCITSVLYANKKEYKMRSLNAFHPQIKSKVRRFNKNKIVSTTCNRWYVYTYYIHILHPIHSTLITKVHTTYFHIHIHTQAAAMCSLALSLCVCKQCCSPLVYFTQWIHTHVPSNWTKSLYFKIDSSVTCSNTEAFHRSCPKPYDLSQEPPIFRIGTDNYLLVITLHNQS